MFGGDGRCCGQRCWLWHAMAGRKGRSTRQQGEVGGPNGLVYCFMLGGGAVSHGRTRVAGDELGWLETTWDEGGCHGMSRVAGDEGRRDETVRPYTS